MASSQPANTTIAVYRQIRAQRDIPIHRSAWETFQKVNPLIMVVPSEEVSVTEVRDASTNVLDTSLTIGRASGFPIVRYPVSGPTLEAAVAGISNLGMPVRIGSDVFLEKTATYKGDDLHQNLRDV